MKLLVLLTLFLVEFEAHGERCAVILRTKQGCYCTVAKDKKGNYSMAFYKPEGKVTAPNCSGGEKWASEQKYQDYHKKCGDTADSSGWKAKCR